MGKTDIVTKNYMRGSDIFADAFNFLIYNGEALDDDSPKHDEAWRHRDEFAEDASPPREEYGKVELEKGFFHKEQRLNLNVMRDDRRFAFA